MVCIPVGRTTEEETRAGTVVIVAVAIRDTVRVQRGRGAAL